MELTKYEINERNFYQKYYSQLEGGKIVVSGVVAEEDPFSGVQFWPTFHVLMPDGTRYVLEVSQDPEGNGPGFLFGLPTGIREQMEVLNSEKAGD